MTLTETRTRKFTMFVVIPAVVSIATIVLLLMLAREFSFPTTSLASVESTTDRPAIIADTARALQQSKGTAPFKLLFDGKKLAGSTDIIKYSWNFGDGETAEGPQVSHIFDLPGTYSVTLQTKTASGTIEEQQVVVNVEKEGTMFSQSGTSVAR